MLHPSTKKLIDRLCEMTLQHKIDWTNGDQDDTLAYDTEGYRVLLEGNPASLVLCDALGNELDRADHNSLSATQHADGGTYEALMATMRGEAVRVARGAEDAIASVLGGLDLDGDGIPDVPAPIDLENAPEGAAAEIYDNVEDSVDEMASLDSQMINTEIEEDGQFADAAEPKSENDLPLAAPPPPEVTLDDSIEHVSETVAEYEAPSLPDPDLESLTTPDVTSTALPDTSQDLGTEVYDNTVAGTPFDDTPDVGEAVANLANQVNNTPQIPEAPQAPEMEIEPSEPAIKRPAAAPSTAGLLTGGIGFNSLSNSLRGSGGTLEQTTNTIAVEEKEVTSPAVNAPLPQEQTAAPSAPPPSEVTMAAPKPGQVLSLSGLTDNIELKAPEPTDSGLVPPYENVPAPSAPEPTEAVLEEPVAQAPTAAQPPAIETPVQRTAEAETPPAEETAQEEADSQKDQQQPPKRFNPWI